MNQNGKSNQVPEVVDPMAAKELIETERKKLQEKRIQELISGSVQPPNETAAYLVQKIQAGLSHGQAVNQRLTSARAMVQQLEQEALRLEGQVEAHVQDLKAWDKPATPAKREIAKETSNESAS